MKTERHETGQLAGIQYTLIYARRRDQMPAADTCRAAWRWWLWIGGEYMGDYSTRRAALHEITAHEGREEH